MKRGVWQDPGNLAHVTRILNRCLQKGGVRVGETAVVSYSVHTIDPSCPSEVRVLKYADAGRVFYQRQQAGEVIHADVFHDVGHVDHRILANKIRQAVSTYVSDSGSYHNPDIIADYIDIQTGTGGGRVTGSLTYGEGDKLRRAHMNHVHLTLSVPSDMTGVLFYLVSAVEHGILEQSRQIRAIERIVHQETRPQGEGDLSDYTSSSDSYLRGSTSDQDTDESRVHRMAMELIEEFETPQAVRSLLDALSAENSGHSMQQPDRSAIEHLKTRGLVRRDGFRYRLTREGEALREYLRLHQRELESQVRKLIRRLPGRIKGTGETKLRRGATRVKKSLRKKVALRTPGESEELAVVETLIQSAKRRVTGEGLRVQPEDIRIYRYDRRVPCDICLLLDASASMAGRRIRAAKYLARHLLLKSKDRVSVITFQENTVDIKVPFTRNYERAERGLSEIGPLGLTPMADGLMTAIGYIKKTRAKNPLLLLITDGIPTVALWSANPLADALKAAEEVGRSRLSFTCIGLEPNRLFLEELSRRTKGSLYTVEELEKESLARIFHREYTR